MSNNVFDTFRLKFFVCEICTQCQTLSKIFSPMFSTKKLIMLFIHSNTQTALYFTLIVLNKSKRFDDKS